MKQKQQKQEEQSRADDELEDDVNGVSVMLRTAVIRRCVSSTASACGSNKEWKAMRREEKDR